MTSQVDPGDGVVARLNRLWSQQWAPGALVALWLVASGVGVTMAWREGSGGIAEPRLVACVVAGVVLVWAQAPIQALCTAVAALVGARGGLLIVQEAGLHGVTTLAIEAALAVTLSIIFYVATRPRS